MGGKGDGEGKRVNGEGRGKEGSWGNSVLVVGDKRPCPKVNFCKLL